MTKIKFCGLTRKTDIDFANRLMPEYIGFVFAEKSRRYITPEKAAELRKGLDSRITPVGVFVNEAPETVARLLNRGVIDMAQLHGEESGEYIRLLRRLTAKPVIQAFKISGREDVSAAEKSAADFVLLDSKNAGSGKSFDWSLIQNLERPYFLAGGLGTDNIAAAVGLLRPYAVDVSTGIETGGFKNFEKMERFAAAVRQSDGKEYVK